MRTFKISDLPEKIRGGIKAYPFVALTLLIGAIGLLIKLSPYSTYAELLVGGYALVIAAWQAYGMVRELLKGNAGLDILAVTAIISATLVGEPWAALVVVLMLTGGEALEDYAANRSKRELTALLNRAPHFATLLISSDGPDKTKQVDVSEVKLGDILVVRAGEIIPVDAELLDDSATFDESSVTGESLPVERKKDEVIVSGVVNGSKAIKLKAVALSEDSQYQQIVKLVKHAQESKAPMVRLADRYAAPFTFLSLFIAAVAWIVTGDAVRFAEVLVVATPCPLLIAAPVAFLGGINRAAKAGLIVKGGGTLEQLSRVKSVAFDKTGTLTTGQAKPKRIISINEFSEDKIISLAASAEEYSSHVLATAIVNVAKSKKIDLVGVLSAEEYSANGVEAETKEGIVRVGKPSWLTKFAPDVKPVELESGEMAIYVTLDGKHIGTIVMRDEIREDSKAVVKQLRTMGIEQISMVTGDMKSVATPVAKRLGIEDVHAECKPADKVQIVSDLQPRPLMMVGDGLNDAPVLAAAEVGFAMGARGATAASESADVVNRFDSISAAPLAIQIGRDTVRVALQSIWLGIIISVALMLVAAFGYLPAIFGAWMQELIDLVAILWALQAARIRTDA